MIKYTPQSQISNTLFKSPFQSDLDQNNRWVLLEKMLPWDEMVTPLKRRMDSKRGRGSIDLRYILGALFIKGLENLSDEDTIRAIQENIYMQYFVGLREFITEPLFVPEVFVEVRKRLGEEGMMEINEKLLKYAHKTGMIHHRKEYKKQNQGGNKGSKNEKLKAESNNPEESQKQGDSSGDTPNRGTLKLDATVADQDVTYPVDTRLLDRVRRETESIIDRIYNLGIWEDKKPRTYRRNAHNDYMNFSKKRRPGAKTIRKCNKQQLQYIARNLRYIDQGWDMTTEDQVMEVFKEPNSYRNQLVVREVYRQQKELFHKRGKKNEPNSIPDRILSFHEPWVRPIVRGKSGRKTEFGAKVNFSETEGFVRVDFNNFNEAKDLKNQIEAFKRLYGHYPAHVLVG